MSNSLNIPIVLWGQKPPSHKISCIFFDTNFKNILTGCRDGQLLLWDINHSSLIPKCMLFGHTSSVVSITSGVSNASTKEQHIASASDVGELCLWDVTDGKCVEQVQLPGSPSQIIFCDITLGNKIQPFIMCFGQFSEISLVNATTLEVAITLASRIFPDWIACAVLMPYHKNTNTFSILGLTVTGMFKVWHLHSVVQPAVLFEEESKQISCPSALEMKLSKTHCGLLIVCSNVWFICDSGDYSVLCSEKVPAGQQWFGGDFFNSETVIVWSRTGEVSLFKLPFNGSNQESFRSSLKINQKFTAQLIKKFLIVKNEQFLLPPTILHYQDDIKCINYLVVGKCNGSLILSCINKDSLDCISSSSLIDWWNDLDVKPVGIIDQLSQDQTQPVTITATLHIVQYSYLCCGCEDGIIIVASAVKALHNHLLLSDRAHKKTNIPHKVFFGHRDRVTCLLYPYQETPERYSQQILISGSADFSVIIWDIFAGTMTHSFHNHGGEVTQLVVPPYGCNPRISYSICSVANDHSIALLSLRDRKCIFLASRHPSPIIAIRWRPDEDFLLVSCADSTLYVWQMETGHLDRFEKGAVAASIISACDEIDSGKTDMVSQSSVNLAQAIKAKSISRFKTVAQQGLRSLIDSLDSQKHSVASTVKENENIHNALTVTALRASPMHDPDAHVIFINTEALIGRLLVENSHKKKLKSKRFKPQSDSSPSINAKTKNFSDLSNHMTNLFLHEESDLSASDASFLKSHRHHKHNTKIEIDSALDIAQVVVSCLHAWGLDLLIDGQCKERLGLLIPSHPVCFGMLSSGGHMALQLPLKTKKNAGNFLHWQISSTLTTQHLVSIISIANTMMELPQASFNNVKIKKRLKENTDSDDIAVGKLTVIDHSQVKQSWSLLATLHCVLLPDKMLNQCYKPPKLELLARRWQDRCLEIREAAQALMLAELRQIGAEGRRKVVDAWSRHVPDYIFQSNFDPPHIEAASSYMAPDLVGDQSSLASDELVSSFSALVNLPYDVRRRHATAVVILGVIGAEFGQELEPTGSHRNDVPDGFGLSDYSLARHTCKALVYLLLQPASSKLPAHVPLRRAAIDLLGRGFTVWEPFMEVSTVLLGLLELSQSYSQHSSVIQSGFPLSPETDSCRSAHHSLSLIATTRPLTFVITIAREVARYNAASVNPQHQSLLASSVLVRSKSEVLRIIELLAEKMSSELHMVLVEIVDIVLFCIDVSVLRASYGLLEAVPALSKFHNISYDARSRRVAVANGHGAVVLYDIRSFKHQTIPCGSGPIAALSFSPDGKYLAVYCAVENQLSFWMVATSLFGMLQSQVKCVKTINPLKTHSKQSEHQQHKTLKLNLSKLVWINNRSVVLLTVDGSEYRFHV